MSLVSGGFLLFAVLAAVIYQWSDRSAYRRIVLLATNLVFLLTLARFVDLWAVLLFAAAGYAALLTVRSAARSAVAWSAVLVALFVYLKNYAIVGFLPAPSLVYTTLGLSYVLFRVLHLVLDSRDDPAAGPKGVVDYFNYLFAFTTLISGPIQRYGHFAAQLDAADQTPVGKGAWFDNLNRLLTGILKIVLVSALLTTAHAHLSGMITSPSGAGGPLRAAAIYTLACVAFTSNVYINFSGYMDIVCSVAQWFGFRLPENFNRPFKAANLLDFWTRWHITLSIWFRDYIFTPLMRRLTEWRPGAAWTTVNGVAALFASFSVMGLWHGTTSVFILYGVMLGGGVAVTWYYQRAARKLLGNTRYRQLSTNLAYVALARGLTFAYFAFALTSFWVDWTKLTRIATNLGPVGVSVAIGALITGAALTLTAMDQVEMRAGPLAGRALARMRGNWLGAGLLAIKLFLILQTAFLSGLSIPEFVYEIY